jgi:hypothetical protein
VALFQGIFSEIVDLSHTNTIIFWGKSTILETLSQVVALRSPCVNIL